MAKLTDILTGAARKLDEIGKEAEGRFVESKAQGDVTELGSGQLLVKTNPLDDIEALNEIVDVGGFSRGVNLGRVGDLLIDTDSMMEDMSVGELLGVLKTNNKELFDAAKRGELSMEKMYELANNKGFTDITKEALARKPGDIANPEDTLAGLLITVKLAQELNYGAKKFLAAPEAEKEEIYKKILVLSKITRQISANVSGSVSEYGRGLSVVSNIGKMQNFNLKEFSEEMATFVSEVDEGTRDFNMFQMTSFTEPAARAKFAENLDRSKTIDVAMEFYINALLASPATHAVNIGGNFGFQVLTLAERGMAGLVGEARQLMGKVDGNGIDSRVYMSEAAAEAYGMLMAQKDAVKLMARTFIKGDDPGKIDLRTKVALGSTNDMTEMLTNVAKGDYFQSGIDTMAMVQRLPGRMLATEDAYFKALSKRRVLYREAHLRGQVAFQNARKAGMSRDEARAKAEQKFSSILIDPPPTVKQMMEAEALEMTFQNKPKGFFGALGPSVSQNPLFKLIVPFYNTPTNIINQVLDRSINVGPSLKALQKGSGREFDIAFGKLMTGWTIVGGVLALTNGYDGDDLVFTGGISMDRKVVANYAGGANVPQYSFGIKQDNGEYKWRTYSRFDPISGLLMMATDYNEYMRNSDAPGFSIESAQAMMTAMTLSVANYAGQMPFLQGISELTDATFNRSGDPEKFAERMLMWLGETSGGVASNVAGSANRMTFGGVNKLANLAYEYNNQFPLIPSDSFSATMERLNDPTMSSAELSEEFLDSNPYMQGFYKARNRSMARNKDFSDKLLPQLNFWGEEKQAGRGKVSETINPIRIQEGGYNALDEELIRLADVGAGAFGFHPKKIQGLKLSDAEQNMLIQLTNQIDVYKSGGKWRTRLPGDDGYNENNTLLGKLADTVFDTEGPYASANFDEERYQLLSDIVSRRRNFAKKQLIKLTPRLSAAFPNVLE